MARTWEFTRPKSMIWRILESIVYLSISKVEYLIYMAMIYSTFENAGLITLIYPFMIFGWALLEETRPSHYFWIRLKWYTTFVLLTKFFVNIKWKIPKFSSHKEGSDLGGIPGAFLLPMSILTSSSNKIVHVEPSLFDEKIFGYMKLGLYSYNNIADIVFYILPEVIIISLLMVNSIYLRMIGFYNLTEDDIEDI